MKVLRRIILFMLALSVLALPIALGESAAYRPILKIEAPTHLDILMTAGEYSLDLDISPTVASVADVEFSIGKSKQISIDELGRITPLKSGKAVLTIKARASEAGATCNVRVLSDEDAAKEVLKLVNAQRKAAKLKALKLDKKLNQAAEARAAELEALFSHTRPDDRAFTTVFDEQKLKYAYKGENIAAGQLTPAQVMNDWINLPSHRENILYPRFTHMGLGVFKTQTGRICWVQMFGGK